MARLSFDAFQQSQSARQAQQTTSDKPRVGFFALKNDGDEALVRFMHDSTADFDIVTTHRVMIDGRTRAVNCIREAREPIDACPLCAAGKPLQQRFYIHLIEYTKNEQGQVVATPKVWERSTAYIGTLKGYIDEYGPLSNVLFKVRRQGAAGSMDTTYNITFANPNVYRNDLYPCDRSVFENYTAVGGAVLDYKYDQMTTLAGQPAGQSIATQAPVNQQPQQTFTQAQPRQYTPQTTATHPVSDNTPPWESKPLQQNSATTGFTPIRRY